MADKKKPKSSSLKEPKSKSPESETPASASPRDDAETSESSTSSQPESPAVAQVAESDERSMAGAEADVPSTDASEEKPEVDNAAEASKDVESASTSTASSESQPASIFMLPARFVPSKPKLRDGLLTGIPLAALAGLMLYKGDVVTPRGNDPAHPLGHYQTLLHSGHIPGSILLGTICLFLAVIGILGLLGDSPLDRRGDESTTPPEGTPAKWYHREGAWLVGFCVLLYVPLAGAYGLWDPWETHYSEVAREILSRDDWITTWWGQEGWFMSKPILIFWLAALGMDFGSTFGLSFWRDSGPGKHEWFIRLPIILLAIGAVYAVYKAVSTAWGRRAGLIVGLVLATMPHWAFLSHQAMTDMPFVAPLVIAMACLMMAVISDPEKQVRARAFNLFGLKLRISVWHVVVGAVLLVALPQIMYLLTRPMQVACGEDAHDSCQKALDASRLGSIQWPIEQYWYGSAGNSAYKDAAATIPGSPPWEDRYNQVPFFTSSVQGLIWLVMGGLLMLSFRRERRQQALLFAANYLFSAISFMGKGPAGLGVPEIVLLGFMITTGKWRILPRIRLLQGITIFLVCGFPWYIGIYCRLGQEFTNRFVVHDLLNRAFAGVHGDTGTFKYFIWQLGYAMFPWTGLVPAALVGWKLIAKDATERQKDIARLALLWFLVTFTLFSMMITKFHHYIFPAVPSAAMLVGLLLHRMLGKRALAPNAGGVVVTGATFVGILALIFGVTNFFGAWHGRVDRWKGERGIEEFGVPAGNAALAWVLLLVGLGLLAFAYFASKKAERDIDVPTSAETKVDKPYRPDLAKDMAPSESVYDRYARVSLGVVALGAAAILVLVMRDLTHYNADKAPFGFARLEHLFTYNYDREFPHKIFNYTPILTGFGLVSVAVAMCMAMPKLRAQAVRMMIACAALFCFWALDWYMIDLSNHWSQRNLFDRYFAMRKVRDPGSIATGEDERYWSEPIAAFQMNWKGENFYTGNHAAMLECGLPLCKEKTVDWLRKHSGQRVFIVTERVRLGSVQSIVSSQLHGTATPVTKDYDNDKFVLIEVRVP